MNWMNLSQLRRAFWLRRLSDGSQSHYLLLTASIANARVLRNRTRIVKLLARTIVNSSTLT
jgi:hypothetical protein